jgi:ribosomal protein S18 acetylase RimI-like enzyme
MEPAFRRAAIADLPDVVRMVRQFHGEEGIDSNEDTVTDSLRRLVGDDSLGRIWLVSEDSKLAGYVILTFGYSIEFRGRDAFVDELYIEEPHRDRGLGLKTLHFVQAAAAELGIRALHLEVAHTNERAAGLYHRLGFQKHDRALMTKWL